MRKIFCTAVLGLALLVGCGAISPAPNYEEAVRSAAAAPFSFSGVMTLDGVEEPLGLHCEKTSSGLTMELTEPETVAGLRVEYSGQSAKICYRELELEMEPGDIPQQSVFASLGSLLPVMSEGQAEEKKGEVLLSGTAELAGYKALWDGKTNTLRSLEIPTSGVKITVENFASGE